MSHLNVKYLLCGIASLKDLDVPQLGSVQLWSWDLLELTRMELDFTLINMLGIKVLSYTTLILYILIFFVGFKLFRANN